MANGRKFKNSRRRERERRWAREAFGHVVVLGPDGRCPVCDLLGIHHPGELLGDDEGFLTPERGQARVSSPGPVSDRPSVAPERSRGGAQRRADVESATLDGSVSRRADDRTGPLPGGPEGVPQPVVGGACGVTDGEGHSWAYSGRANVPHPKCDGPNLLRCDCGAVLVVRCQSTRADRCVPCSESHRRRLAAVVRSGVAGDRPSGYFWCTLTAPGVEALPWDESQCAHGPEVECSGKRGCRVGAFDAAVWNGTAPKRWSWFITYLRRRLGPLEFVGVWEYQERGVLHRHFLMRCERPVTTKRAQAAVRNCGRRWGFGARWDVQAITGDAARQAWYVAKYSTKTAGSMDGGALLDVRTGELRRCRGFRPWSASRQWGETMRGIRERQRAWACGQHLTTESAGAGTGRAPQAPLDLSRESSTPGGGVVAAEMVEAAVLGAV